MSLPEGSHEGIETYVAHRTSRTKRPGGRGGAVPATKLSVQLNERSHDRGSLRDQGPFVVPGGRAVMLAWGRGEGSHLVNGVRRLGTSHVRLSGQVEV